MNDKTKIIGACLLIVAGVGIWVPQIPGMLGRSEGAQRTPLPAVNEMPMDMPGGDDSLDGNSDGRGVPSRGAAAQSRKSEDPLARIEALLLDERKSEDEGLATLAMSWQQSTTSREAGDGEPAEEPRERSDAETEDPGRERPEPIPFNGNFGSFGSSFSESSETQVLDPFDAFLADFPLSGLILGEKRQLASFGPYTLELGDFIPGTNAKVLRIERRSVIVSRDRKEYSISLPPFRSNSAPAEDQLPGAIPDDPEGNPVGVATPSPPSSNPVQPAALTGDDQ